MKLKVQGLANSQIQSGAFALILIEEEGMRRMPIIVGTAEAQSIAIVLERLTPPRPLTHDLFVSFMKAFHIQLKKVCIHRFEDGIYFSKLLLVDEANNETEIDSRTSDAIAIALRVNAEIYTTEEIITQSGIILEEDKRASEEEVVDEKNEPAVEDRKEKTLAEKILSLADATLIQMLEKAIAEEKYEEATIIQEELNRRRNG